MCFGNKELSRSHNKKACSLRLQQETQSPFYDMKKILCLDELIRQRGMIQSKQTNRDNVVIKQQISTQILKITEDVYTMLRNIR